MQGRIHEVEFRVSVNSVTQKAVHQNRCCLSPLVTLGCLPVLAAVDSSYDDTHPLIFDNPSHSTGKSTANPNDVCQRFEVHCSKRL